MQIDHDRNELPRTTLKIVAVAAILLTIAIMIPVNFGIQWVVEQMPITLIALVFGLMMGLCGGFYIGAWDARRQFRTNGNDA